MFLVFLHVEKNIPMNRNTKRKTTLPKNRATTLATIAEQLKGQRARVVLSVLLGLFSLFLLFSMIGFFFSGGIDQSLVDKPMRKIIANPEIIASNPAGKAGAWISNLLINRWFGIPSFIFCYLVALCSIRVAGVRVRHFRRRLFIGMLCILWLSLLLGFITESIADWFDAGTGYLFPGGGHGYFVSIWLHSLVGRIGTVLLLIFTFIIIFFFLFFLFFITI